jgi:hypothetical protein
MCRGRSERRLPKSGDGRGHTLLYVSRLSNEVTDTSDISYIALASQPCISHWYPGLVSRRSSQQRFLYFAPFYLDPVSYETPPHSDRRRQPKGNGRLEEVAILCSHSCLAQSIHALSTSVEWIIIKNDASYRVMPHQFV